jgi:hypothetical protein
MGKRGVLEYTLPSALSANGVNQSSTLFGLLPLFSYWISISFIGFLHGTGSNVPNARHSIFTNTATSSFSLKEEEILASNIV